MRVAFAMPKDVKERFMERAANNLRVARVGRPEDVAEAIVMLVINGFVAGRSSRSMVGGTSLGASSRRAMPGGDGSVAAAPWGFGSSLRCVMQGR
jgi:hypothetical protein